MIQEIQAQAFQRSGYCLATNFYDLATEIQPIVSDIGNVIARVASAKGVDIPCATPEQAMTEGYLALIGRDRAWGGVIYDAVKQIPAFLRLVSSAKNDAAFRALREGSTPGIAAGGFGIRIDNPGEDRFRAPWHQEFPAQLRSVDGVVFWTPLLSVTTEMGPVEIASGSHVEGIVPVYDEAADAGRTGAYALRLDREEERLARYSKVAPLTRPGDLILMDFLTLHQSGLNRSNKPRWSIQFRYFNYADPVGSRIGWTGSFAANVDFRQIVPELASPAAQP